MPELPEVRTVAVSLKKKLLNKRVKEIKIIYPKVIEPDSLNINLLINEKLIDIKTYGKYLIFDFDKYYLVSHLRMEGKFFLKDEKDLFEKHEHIIIYFEDISLRYHDTRKFGRMSLVNKTEYKNIKGLAKLSYEPFDSKMTKEYLYNKLKNKRKPMKSLLLDQTIIAGLGNIYVNEVLFASKINPLRIGADISLNECQKVIDSSIKILEKAIKLGGTTIRSYTSSLGVTGNYQDYLCVHTKENHKCQVCKSLIKKIEVGGRSTYFCPKCQE